MTHTTHRPFLMGAETEYGVSGLRGGAALEADEVYDYLVAAIKRRRAWVPDNHTLRSLYLEHGGRLYLDYGAHPEHATPECFTPRQVAIYDKAGEYLLRLGRDMAMSEDDSLRLRVLKNNLDPVEPDCHSYGTHESYTCWVSSQQAGPCLVPHLVSRVLYAGAGGLTGHAKGHGFELSQRARHLRTVTSDDTTYNRAIFSTRIRKTTDGGETWTRVHLISKDAHRAPLGIYLTYATTGLLIEMLNRGHDVARGLELVDPVVAIQRFSRDPWLRAKAPLVDGRELTALDIQALYLEECERAVQRGGLPEWAGEALGVWRQTLADLERDPLRLADRLDPYCKLLIYEHELLRGGYDWSDLREALASLHDLRSDFSEAVVRAVLDDSAASLGEDDTAAFHQARDQAGLARPGTLEKLRFATRMQALELNYHELGGLYDRLHELGRVKDLILTPADVETASRIPPAGGRAEARGEWIRDHREDGWRGDWQFVWHAPGGRCLDLRDPFTAGREVQLQLPEGVVVDEVEVLDLLGE